MAYQRHFSRMAELSGTQAGSWRWRLGFWERILDRVVLRTAYEQAGFRFVVRSLFRSDRHRAAVAVFAAVGLRWSVLCGLLELLVSAVLAATLIAGLVLAYRKLPFTCAKSGFQHNALVKALLCVLGVFAFAFLPALVEHWARSSPVRLLVLAPLLALIWWGIREARSAQLDIDRQIVFLDPVQSGVELLNLNA